MTLEETCCLYAKQSGVIRENLVIVRGNPKEWQGGQHR